MSIFCIIPKGNGGDANVPEDYQLHGLGQWVTRQKRYELEGKLETSRRDRLQALGLRFVKTREERWEENYRQLRLFRDKMALLMMLAMRN